MIKGCPGDKRPGKEGLKYHGLLPKIYSLYGKDRL